MILKRVSFVWRALAGRLALSAASLAFVLILLELGLRTAGVAPKGPGDRVRTLRVGRALLLDCYPSNPRGYFDIDLRSPAVQARYAAGGLIQQFASTTPFAVEYRFNSQRFRGPEFKPKAAGTFRVAILGDSFTEGRGVREADALPSVLERVLNAGEPGRWEVLNCGRRGADFPALYETFEELLPESPDLVIYALVLNDVERAPGWDQAYPALNDWILDQHGRIDRDLPLGLARSRLARLLSERVKTYFMGRQTTRWYKDLYGDENRLGWERTQDYWQRMNRQLKENGGGFLIVSWPLLLGLEGDYPFASLHATIGHACLRLGIPYDDLLPVLRGQRSSALWAHPLDMHPNEIAHRQVAEHLAPLVRALASSRPLPSSPAAF